MRDGEVSVRVRLPTLGDVNAIRAAIREVAAALVIIDPLTAYTVGDTHVDAEMRGLLVKLSELAADLSVAVIVVRHLNKSGGTNPLYRGGGSIAFIASARSALLAALDPDDPAGLRRILAATKCNLATEPPSLIYQLEAASNGAVRVAWLGETRHTAKSVLAAQTDTEDERTATDKAVDYLADMLSNGEQLVRDIQRQAHEAGITDKALRRARERIGVTIRREGFGPGSKLYWRLPDHRCHLPA